MPITSDNYQLKNIIFGIAGKTLTIEEQTFFKEVNPLGFILFKRNCETKEQIASLVKSLKTLLKREEILILIDQEGGRVARLTPPNFRATLPAKVFGDIAKYSLENAIKAVYINHLLIGRELKELGINVNCTPVADLLHHNTNDVIGDRSFGDDKNIVIELCKAADLGLRDSGIQSIIKHIPGHGRAQLDSHHALPVITDELHELENSDFGIFKALSYFKMAMTAHVVYEKLDTLPVTLSAVAIRYIKHVLGFDGLLITDDLSMKALSWPLQHSTLQALEAGCDILLHCNGDLDEMMEISQVIRNINNTQFQKIQKLNNFCKPPLNGELYAMETNQLEDMLSTLLAL